VPRKEGKTMSIEAMKQALEAFDAPILADEHEQAMRLRKACDALRQAIEFEEMVKKGTKAWADTPDGWVDDLRGGAEKQEPVGYLYDWLNPDNRDEVIRDWFAASMYVIEKDKGFNVRPLYTSPVHASENAEKQEPVAWIKESEIAGMSASAGLGIFEWKTNLGLKPEPGDVPLYTAPREWVGLTDEERFLNDARSEEEIEYARAIEAKLKEKNNG
jgi:hypothetical protein